MKKGVRILVASLCVWGLTACGASKKTQDPAPEAAEQTQQPAEPPPECLPGCQENDDGVCETSARSVDPSGRIEEQTIECDPRCCSGESPSQNAIDADGDGIINDRDECIEEAEDFDGFQDDDGCPDPDNDGDNILDADDICPLDAEDFDGFQDDDGCPD